MNPARRAATPGLDARCFAGRMLFNRRFVKNKTRCKQAANVTNTQGIQARVVCCGSDRGWVQVLCLQENPHLHAGTTTGSDKP